MPVSKKRKKRGKKVGNGMKGRTSHVEALEAESDRPSGVTLQDLINVLAAQEHAKPDDDPTKMHNPNSVPTIADVPEGPDAESIIRAVHDSSKMSSEENADEQR